MVKPFALAASTIRSESKTTTLRDKLNARTHELAAIAGRKDAEITQRDYEQAKCELTGEVDLDRQNAALDEKKHCTE